MGGAPGHMQHPFDLPQVKTGNDLIDFFNAAAREVQQNPAAVKIDGVNVSFKLVEGPQFAVDRGSLKPVDIQGITLDRVAERGMKGGLANSVTMLLTILNEALPSLMSELKALGMDKDPSLFLNTEYVSETTNVTAYEDKFIAIHGLNQFYEKTPFRGGGMTRPGAQKPFGVKRAEASYELRSSANDPAMISLVEKLKPFAEKYNFKVHGTVPSYSTGPPDFTSTLNTEFTVNLGTQPSAGELEVTEEVPRTQTLGEWLAEAINPFDATVTLTDGRKVGAMSKLVYAAVLEGALITDLLAEGEEWWQQMSTGQEPNPEGDVKKAIDGAVMYHATRLLGNDIFAVTRTDAMGKKEQSVTEHEGLVLRNPELFGPKPVKITGEFLWKGWKETAFGVNESLKRLNEQIDVRGCQRKLAVVPGAFKPPHKGHLKMIQNYSANMGPDGMVYVYVSPIPASARKEFDAQTQADVTPEQSMAIWEIYTQDLPNVQVGITPPRFKTPVQAAYEFIGVSGPTQPGDCVFMGASTKGGDEKRFANLQRYAKEGVQVKSYPVIPFGDLSATDFRVAIKAGDLETISNVFLPTEEISAEQEVAIYNILGIDTQPNEMLQELLVGLIQEAAGAQTQDLRGQTILLVGDSHMAGDYGKNLENALRKRGARVVRAAQGSSGARYWNDHVFGNKGKHKWNPEPHRQKIRQHKYDRVIASFGGNDSHAAARSGSGRERFRQEKITKFMKNLQRISPNVEFLGPPQARRDRADAALRREINNMYRKSAEESGIKYHDMINVVDDNRDKFGKGKPWTDKMGVHFSGKSAKAYSDVALKKLGVKPTTAGMTRRQRTLHLAKRTGVDPRMIQAIEFKESSGNPNAIAFNPKRVERWLQKHDPEKLASFKEIETQKGWSRNDKGVLNPVYGKMKNDYRNAWDSFNAVREVSPAAAINATAFGHYQVLGPDLLTLYDNDPEKALKAFKENSTKVSADLFEKWADRYQKTKGWKDLANKADFGSVARHYFGGRDKDYETKLANHWEAAAKEYDDDWQSEVADIDLDKSVDYGTTTTTKPITIKPGSKGRFVHGFKKEDFPEFDFDKFYKELDLHFKDAGGSTALLSDYGQDYKFGREHQAAMEALRKSKELQPELELVAEPLPEPVEPPEIEAAVEPPQPPLPGPEPPQWTPPAEFVGLEESAVGEFQRTMKKNLKKEHEWLLDLGPQDPGSAYAAKRVGAQSNAFVAMEQKINEQQGEWRTDEHGVPRPGVYDPMQPLPEPPGPGSPREWTQYKTGGPMGKVQSRDTIPWPEDASPLITQTRRDLYDSYTSGPNRQAWEDKVGKEVYERDILPQIQYVTKNVPINLRKLEGGAAGVAKGNKIELDPEYADRPSTTFHELAHVVDQHFNYKLSREQAGKLANLVDMEKLWSASHRYPDVAQHMEWAVDPAEIEAEVIALRNKMRRRLTPEDVGDICSGKADHGTHLEKFLDCSDIQKTTSILNSIVKLDAPKTQQKQMVAEEQIDEISAMGAGAVEGAPGLNRGPWREPDEPIKMDGFAGATDKQTGNKGVFVGERAIKDGREQKIDEVLNYLLAHMESIDED